MNDLFDTISEKVRAKCPDVIVSKFQNGTSYIRKGDCLIIEDKTSQGVALKDHTGVVALIVKQDEKTIERAAEKVLKKLESSKPSKAPEPFPFTENVRETLRTFKKANH